MVSFCRSMGRRAAAVLPGLTAAAAGGADIVVHHPVLPLGQHLAEMLGVPAVVAQPQPALVPTREFVSAAWPFRAPRILNRPSYRAARQLTGAWCRRDIDRWRRDVLALPPRRGRHNPLLACDGGPVTTAAAVVASRPQVTWPFGIDQSFWSDRMSRLGVAPAALPVRALTGRTLTAALDRALGDPRMTERAAGLGSLVRAEDGVGQAVSRLEDVLAGTRLAVGA